MIEVSYIAILWVAAVLQILLALLIYRRQPITGTMYFVGLLLMSALWSLFYGIQLTYQNESMVQLSAKLVVTVIFYFPSIWFLLALRYTDVIKALSNRFIAFLLGVPTFTLLFLWTNSFHELFWSSINFEKHLSHIHFIPTAGIAVFLYILFALGILVSGMWRLIQHRKLNPNKHKWQHLALMNIVMMPTISTAIYVVFRESLDYLDPTPLAYFVSISIGFLSLYRPPQYVAMPTTAFKFVNSLPNPVIILSDNYTIITVNRAA